MILTMINWLFKDIPYDDNQFNFRSQRMRKVSFREKPLPEILDDIFMKLEELDSRTNFGRLGDYDD